MTYPGAPGSQPFYDSEHEMPHTHDSRERTWTKGPLLVHLQPLFWHLQKYPRRRVAPQRPPLSEQAAPRELDPPWRTGQARILRVPLTRKAVVVGYWEPASDELVDESTALLAALDGAHIKGITATEIAGWTKAADVLSWWDALVERVRVWFELRSAPEAFKDAMDAAMVRTEDYADRIETPAGTFVFVPRPEDDVVVDLEDVRTAARRA